MKDATKSQQVMPIIEPLGDIMGSKRDMNKATAEQTAEQKLVYSRTVLNLVKTIGERKSREADRAEHMFNSLHGTKKALSSSAR